MSRAVGLGLATALAVAVGYGVLWLIASWGLVVAGFFGGWLIGSSVARGLRAGGSWPRGASTAAALLGILSWLVGSYVAFVIVQLLEGSGGLLGRIGPAHFATNLAAIADPPWMQLAIVGAFMAAAAFTARAPRANSAPAEGR
ncbi:hypothetical protein BH23CHL7_BH23CHL7_03860 [soil metagenome]